MQVSSIRGYAVFVGLDVGKSVHHATALDVAGARFTTRRCRTTRPGCGHSSGLSACTARS